VATVAVCIPTIPPRWELLARALDSVEAQTRVPDEVIVVRDDHRLGPSQTRNACLASVTSDYVAWLDDDDEFLPWHLELCLDAITYTEADLVYPWFERDDGYDPLSAVMRRQVLGLEFDDTLRYYLLHTNNFIPVTTIIRTEKLREIGGFPERNSERWPHAANEEWGCWKELLNAGAKFVHAPHVTWRWNRHGIDRMPRGTV
jgi:hypothetical protein